ncbi:SHOCT domain-containing protein [Spirosoma liriopis]
MHTHGLSPAEQLERLAALREKGMLTQDEYEQQKRQVLG